MDGISPTRMNLLTRRSQLGLASRGRELLEKKRDALVQEFFANIHQALEARNQLAQAAQEAHRSLLLAKAFEGPETVEALARTVPVAEVERPGIDNIWGTRVPRLRDLTPPPAATSPLTVGGNLVVAQAAFQRLAQTLIQVANTESRLRQIAQEIKKTARRVNALQQVVIPGIRSQISIIQQALDQQEQEDVFRLKRIKAKIAAASLPPSE